MRVLLVGDDEHRRRAQLAADRYGWIGSCSCGRMPDALGGAGQVALAWQAHVEGEAQAAGVEPRTPTPRPRTARDRKRAWWATHNDEGRRPEVGGDGPEAGD